MTRGDDEWINGENCVVFKAGTNADTHFATIDWFAISEEGKVYVFDIINAVWVPYEFSLEISVECTCIQPF